MIVNEENDAGRAMMNFAISFDIEENDVTSACFMIINSLVLERH